MFDKEMLKGLIHERLSEAAGEIFALFEQAAAEYQREIDCLKNVNGTKRVVVDFRGPQMSIKRTQLTEPLSQQKEDNTGSFRCKEEVPIKRENQPQIVITDIKGSGKELHARGQKQTTKNEEEETDTSSESHLEHEEECFDMDCDVEDPFGPVLSKKQFSCSVRTPPGQSLHEAPNITKPLGTHVRARAEDSPYSCTECDITFAKQSFLIDHVHRVHSTDHPLKCIVCTKSFVHLNAFMTHMESHTGERPFMCPLCGKRFTQKSTLNRHMTSHSGEKPFKCAKCDKIYSTKQSLTVHMNKNH